MFILKLKSQSKRIIPVSDNTRELDRVPSIKHLSIYY